MVRGHFRRIRVMLGKHRLNDCETGFSKQFVVLDLPFSEFVPSLSKIRMLQTFHLSQLFSRDSVESRFFQFTHFSPHKQYCEEKRLEKTIPPVSHIISVFFCHRFFWNVSNFFWNFVFQCGEKFFWVNNIRRFIFSDPTQRK